MEEWVDGWMKISFDRLSGGEWVDKNGECLNGGVGGWIN